MLYLLIIKNYLFCLLKLSKPKEIEGYNYMISKYITLVQGSNHKIQMHIP